MHANTNPDASLTRTTTMSKSSHGRPSTPPNGSRRARSWETPSSPEFHRTRKKGRDDDDGSVERLGRIGSAQAAPLALTTAVEDDPAQPLPQAVALPTTVPTLLFPPAVGDAPPPATDAAEQISGLLRQALLIAAEAHPTLTSEHLRRPQQLLNSLSALFDQPQASPASTKPHPTSTLYSAAAQKAVTKPAPSGAAQAERVTTPAVTRPSHPPSKSASRARPRRSSPPHQEA